MSKKNDSGMSVKQALRFAIAPVIMAALAAPLAGASCDQVAEAAGDLAEQCGLTCPAEGILQGNASISGIASIDAFFGAVVDFTGAANTVSVNIRTQLDAMAASVGLEAGASAADIKAAIQAKITANASGGIQVKIQEPKCQASLEVTAKAAASCDASVDPGSVEVKCGGSCTIDASAQAECAASGTLTCKGQAPGLACEGTCTGACTLDVAATCEGECRGECTGTCSVTDANGNCRGKCEGGTCKGTCELAAGGSCDGQCEGSCEYTPPSGSCDATAEAKCTASANASVKCKGGCDGKVEPPQVKAECQATVEAKADASVECTPPSIEVTWQWSAAVQGDAAAQADFRAWIGNFKLQYSAMFAAVAKAELLADTAVSLVGAAEGAVTGAANVAAEGDLKAAIGAGCALVELPNVGTAIQASADGLTANISAVAEITAAVGG
jgi:hypothetical protein